MTVSGVSPLKRSAAIIIAAAVLLVTLFFGLKPKGFRFVNQAHIGEQSLVFTNIGMAHSIGTLGNIGITDAVGIAADIKPVHTGRRLMRLAALVDAQGFDRLTIDQWTDGVEISIWNIKGKRIGRTGSSAMVSRDSVRQIYAGISGGSLFIVRQHDGAVSRSRKVELPGNWLAECRLVVGMGGAGNNPWRGSVTSICVVNKEQRDTALAVAFDTAGGMSRFSAFRFLRDGQGTVSDVSGNGWHLSIPRLPKIYRHHFLTWHDLTAESIDRSLAADVLVNFFGFYPFGVAGFLLFASFGISSRRAFFATVLAALLCSLGIEISQGFIPTRTSQLMDVILNFCGAGAGVVFLRCGGKMKVQMLALVMGSGEGRNEK